MGIPGKFKIKVDRSQYYRAGLALLPGELGKRPGHIAAS